MHHFHHGLLGEAVVLKYSNEGTLLWSEFLSGGNHQANVATAVDTDSCNGIVVAGVQLDNGTALNILIRKYDADGGLLWERDEITPLTDWALGLSVDASGRTVATGCQVDADSNYYDFWMRQYDSDGNELWTLLEDGGVSETDAFNGSVGAENGSVWAAGVTTGAPGMSSAVLRRYDAGGALVWAREMNLGGQDAWLSVARAPDGRIGVGGTYALPFPFDTEAIYAVYPP